jgi:23S rRNA pseudouridine2605 synthase
MTETPPTTPPELPAIDSAQSDSTAPESERIAKRLARAGVCSRRDAEKLILEGRVSVNGKVLTSPATLVSDADSIVANGKPVAPPEPTRLFRYHKTTGLVVSHKDEQGRPTVFERMPPELPRLISVGRLDLNSEGLLLLTNDGELARFLEHPSTGLIRRYRCRVHGEIDPARLASLAKGLTVDGVVYGPIEAEMDHEEQVSANSWITVSIREGKNREVRKVLEAIDLSVNRLIRVAYGPIQLGKLAPGETEEVPRRVIRDQFGSSLTDERSGEQRPTRARTSQPAAMSPSITTTKQRVRGRTEREVTVENAGLSHRGKAKPGMRPVLSLGPRPKNSFATARPAFRAPEDTGDAVAERPVRPQAERSYAERPARDAAAEGPRPFRSGPRTDGPRPPRDGAGDGQRPFRSGPRTDGPRPPRDGASDGPRPFRSGPRSDGPRPPRDGASDGPRPFRSGPRTDGPRPPRDGAGDGQRSFRSGPRTDGPRPPRDGAGDGQRSFRSGPRSDGPRPPRDGAGDGQRSFRSGPRSDGPRPPRDGAGDGQRSFRSGPRTDGPRPPRDGAGDGPRAPREERKFNTPRPPRAGAGDGPKPARSFGKPGGKPGGKPSGGKVFVTGRAAAGGKPAGRPGGGFGGKPGGKPGGRPGGKPSGGGFRGAGKGGGGRKGP